MIIGIGNTFGGSKFWFTKMEIICLERKEKEEFSIEERW